MIFETETKISLFESKSVVVECWKQVLKLVLKNMVFENKHVVQPVVSSLSTHLAFLAVQIIAGASSLKDASRGS